MDAEKLKGILKQGYSRERWVEMLAGLFKGREKTIFIEQQKIDFKDGENAYTGYLDGYIETADRDRIGFFTYSCKRKVGRRKSGLRNLVNWLTDRRYGQVQAAVVAFYEEEGSEWRISYICDIDGERTSAKRFTFLAGDGGAEYRTAVERFMMLSQNNVSLGSLYEAFSVEALSKEFFNRYNAIYSEFCEHAYKYKDDARYFEFQKFGEKEIRDYVKLLLGRIVFLCFVQKKGWMNGDANFLKNIFEAYCKQVKEEGIEFRFLDNVLERLFFDCLNAEHENPYQTVVHKYGDGGKVSVPFLNGGLFEQKEIDIPKSVFGEELWRKFFDLLGEYNFTIDENDPNDAEIGIDPEMLGKIFESQLEDNKDKGAFYTPKEIVQYMCRESVEAYLRANEEAIKTDEDKLRLLKEIKVCDPAIGSGAFPMGMLAELCKRRQELGEEVSAEMKREIVQNNIYGVDIEEGAVDIARLRFWLSIVVESDKPEALPNLDFKIMRGNSLLEEYKGVDLSHLCEEKKENGVTLYDNEMDVKRRELKKKIGEYYGCSDHRKKKEMIAEIKGMVDEQLAGLWGNNNEIDVDLVANDRFFLWHTWFEEVFERGGFDVVIGNPPYGAKVGKEEKEAYKKNYITAKTIKGKQKGSTDTYTVFIEQGYNLLKKGGSLAYIIPISFTSSESLTGVHLLLKSNCEEIKVSSYAVRPQPVFENAVVNTSILSFVKTNTPCQRLLSTKMHRKGKGFNLQNLIDNLSFVDVRDCCLYGRIPKIGTEMEKNILQKVLKFDRIETFIRTEGSPIYYRTTGGRYFKVVTNYSTGSTKETIIELEQIKSNAIGCLLSSNLSFWFYQIISNNLDWKSYEIQSFTIPPLTEENIAYLNELYRVYLEDIEKNANVRVSSKESSYNVDSFKEYKIGRSKAIIDKIDDYIAPLYGLTSEECEFIKNYEIEFRLGEQ